MNDDRWSVNDIAASAGVTGAAVSNWRRRFSDTFPQQGPDRRFDPAEVEAWLAATGRASERVGARSPKPPSRPRDDRYPSDKAVALALKILRAAGADPLGALSVMAGLIAIRGLGADPGPLRDIGRLERALQLPQGCLRVALSPAADLSPGTIDDVAAALGRTVTDLPSADAALTELLRTGPTARAAAEHLSTTRLATFVAQALPDRSRSLLDPACGTGGLLIAAAARLGARRVAGFEIDPPTWAIAVIRTTLAGLDADIRRGDFFTGSPGLFDTVVAQPPLGDRVRLDLLDDLGPVSELRRSGPQDPADVGWLLGCYQALAPGGTAYVLTSAGMTFSRRATDARRELIRMGAVLAVVSMPPGLLADSAAAASLWVLRRQQTPPPGVLLVDAAAPYPLNRQADPLEAAADHVRSWCADPQGLKPVPGFSEVVGLLDLVGPRAELSPSTWTAVPISTRPAARKSATEALQALQGAAEDLRRTHLPPLRVGAGPEPRLVSLADLAREGLVEIQRPRPIRSSQLEDDGRVPYAARIGRRGLQITGRLQEVPPGGSTTQPGDLVLSTIHPLRAVVDREGGHVLGSSLLLIRSLTDEPGLQPDLLALLLTNPRIAARAVGSTVRRLRGPADIEIPRLDPADAEALLRWLDAATRAERAASALVDAKAGAVRAINAALDSGARIRI